jgi:hypothetical protein
VAGTPPSSREASGGGLTVLFDETLAGDAAAIDTGAGGIAGDCDVLYVWVLARTSQAVVTSSALLEINGDTGTNYDFERVRGANVTLAGFGAVAQAGPNIEVPGNNSDAGAVGVIVFTIPGYAQTTFHKVADWRAFAPEDTVGNLIVGSGGFRWRNTAAITQLTVTAGGGVLRAGSRLLVLGV